MNLAELLTLKDKHDLVKIAELTNTQLGMLAAFFVRNQIQKTPIKSRSKGRENLSFITKRKNYRKERSKEYRAKRGTRIEAQFKVGYFTPSIALVALYGPKQLKKVMLEMGGKPVRYYHKDKLIRGYADIYLNRSSIKIFDYGEWVKENLVYTGKSESFVSFRDIHDHIFLEHGKCGDSWVRIAMRDVFGKDVYKTREGEFRYKGFEWKKKNG